MAASLEHQWGNKLCYGGNSFFSSADFPFFAKL